MDDLESEIDYIVRASFSRHLDDERTLCEMNGIMTLEPTPSSLTYWVETDRITVRWQTKTQSQEDVALRGLLAPFNDDVKHGKLKNWMEQHPNLVSQVKLKLERAKKAMEEILGE